MSSGNSGSNRVTVTEILITLAILGILAAIFLVARPDEGQARALVCSKARAKGGLAYRDLQPDVSFQCRPDCKWDVSGDEFECAPTILLLHKGRELRRNNFQYKCTSSWGEWTCRND